MKNVVMRCACILFLCLFTLDNNNKNNNIIEWFIDSICSMAFLLSS